MKQVVITGGIVVTVDDEDEHFLTERYWRLWVNPRRPENRYVQAAEKNSGKRTTVKLHRLIVGALPGQKIDHVNGDTLDNRRSNLRLATTAQNAWNQGKRVTNTSGFKGVYLHQQGWKAVIGVNGCRYHLGYFKTPAAAGAAYRIAAERFHGEFARSA